MLSPDDIKRALAAVKYPGYSRDIVSFGLVKEISAANGAVNVLMQLTSPNPEAAQQTLHLHSDLRHQWFRRSE